MLGSSSLDIESDLRLNFEARKGGWSFDAAYQLFAGYGDRVNATGFLPGGAINRLPNDDRRFFNLTSVIDDSGKFVNGVLSALVDELRPQSSA